MLLSREPHFIKRLGAIWSSVSHIQDLSTLKKQLLGSTFVAFDLEGHVTRINEIGLATLHVAKSKPLHIPELGSIRTFYDRNKVHAYTVIIEEEQRKKTYEAIKYGNHVTVPNKEVGKTLHTILSALEEKSNQLILMGYDMYTEFDWISRACPSLLSRFNYWIDVQDAVEETCGSRPSLLNTMEAMNLADQEAGKAQPSGHRASNDAVRTLAVLSTLLSVKTFEYHRLPTTKLLSTTPRHWDNYPFKARITAYDDCILPTCIKTPRALSAHFSAYRPMAVLINSRAAASKGVRVWWVCLRNRELLDNLADDVDRSIL
jgi:hypothetical protein